MIFVQKDTSLLAFVMGTVQLDRVEGVEAGLLDWVEAGLLDWVEADLRTRPASYSM